MNYFLKYRFAIWAVIILSVIVLSSVSTVLFFRLNIRSDKSFKDQEAKRHAQISQFFKSELKFTPEQEKIFKENRREFFENSKIIFDSLEKERIHMIEEFSKPSPDSVALYKIADQIGELHAQQKYETIRNLLKLQAICTPEQIQKLSTVYKDLIGPEGPMHRRGPGPHPDKKEQQRPGPP
jgi:hypothetical protein